MKRTKLCKTSKHTTYANDVYLCIISYVQTKNKLPTLGMSKQSRNRYVSRLKKWGIIKKRGYGFWVFIGEKDWQKEVNKQGNDTKNIGGHAFHYRLRLPDLKNWDKREKFLIKYKIPYVPSKAVWKGYRLIILGYKVWLCDNS